MAPERSFSEVIRGVRAGDPDAVRDLVRAYEPYLRRTFRRRLANTPLQAAADSADLCQSVLGAFLIRFVAGALEVHTQDDLLKLLLGIARKKFARLRRREGADRRDRGRTAALGSDPNLPDARAEDPSVVLTRDELLRDVRRRMADGERELFELRRAGYSWDEIAARVGEPAARLRKRYSRAIQGVCQELGLEAPDE